MGQGLLFVSRGRVASSSEMDRLMSNDLLMSGMRSFWPIALLVALQYVDIKEMGLFGVLQLFFALSFAFCVVFAFYVRSLILKAANGDEKVDLRDEDTGKSEGGEKFT